MARTKTGFLVLADISGFTEFVTATALEHGPPIIADLLQTVIERIAPPLAVQEIEGDAVFALGPAGTVVPPGILLDVLRGGFAGFRDRRREIDADESCACGACRSVARLRLKIIGHYGPFLEQTVGGRGQVAGSDVILAHRLLKNGVDGSADYVLLTRPALETMNVDPSRAGFLPHTERYQHFGTVDCFVQSIVAGEGAPTTTRPVEPGGFPGRAIGAS